MERQELGRCLRGWRDRLSPASVGLPAGGRRRAPGFRRTEVALLAGLSVDYLARLDQGRAGNPSPSVVESLARALRLSHDENAHLFRLAGHADPRINTVSRHIPPGLRRMLDRMADIPVLVLDAAWQVVATNPLLIALLGDLSAGPAHDQNRLWAALHRRPVTRRRHRRGGRRLRGCGHRGPACRRRTPPGRSAPA